MGLLTRLLAPKGEKFDFTVWMVKKDDPIRAFVNFIYGARHLWSWPYRKWIRLGRQMMKRQHVNGGKMFVVLNGPSAKKQPLERVVGKMDIICVNQGFRLPCYKKLQPKYHIFIDNKMLKGIWDVRWIDEILEMVPDITIVLPAAWGNSHLFQPYIRRGVKILWFGLHSTHGVSAAAFNLAFALGYKEVYFTGYEGTAFPAMLMNMSSHFYGADPDEEEMMKPNNIMKNYQMGAWHFSRAKDTVRRVKKRGLRLINLTDGGIMNMYDRMPFDEVFPGDK